MQRARAVVPAGTILNVGFRSHTRRPETLFNTQSVRVPPRLKNKAKDLPIILAAMQKRTRRAEKRKEWMQSMGIFGNKSAIWIQTLDGRIGRVRDFVVTISKPGVLENSGKKLTQAELQSILRKNAVIR